MANDQLFSHNSNTNVLSPLGRIVLTRAGFSAPLQVQAWKTHNWKKRDANDAVRKQQRKFHFKEIAG